MAEGGWIGRYEVVPYYLPAADERHGGRCNFCVTSRWHVVNSSLTSANLNLRGFEIWREEIRNRNRLTCEFFVDGQTIVELPGEYFFDGQTKPRRDQTAAPPDG